MKIFPAIDIRDKRAVRLTQGDYDKMDVYSDDPAAVARRFADAGAACLHVVDLDGARDGALSNYDVITRVLQATDMFVEVGGGIRDAQRVERYLSLGVGRVILGTAAVKDEDFLRAMLKEHGEKIAVGVDARDGYVATDGWKNVTKVEGVEFCRRLAEMGVKNIIYTDIARDGAMQGTNLPVYRVLNKIEGVGIIASGGISTLAELQVLRAMNTRGAVLGKALYINALRLEDALRVARGGDL